MQKSLLSASAALLFIAGTASAEVMTCDLSEAAYVQDNAVHNAVATASPEMQRKLHGFMTTADALHRAGFSDACAEVMSAVMELAKSDEAAVQTPGPFAFDPSADKMSSYAYDGK